MTIRQLVDTPTSEVAAALATFEEQFHYPLGSGRTFTIRHGDDYPRFFRAMGEACCLVAEQDDRVVGVLSVAVRPIQHPDRSVTNTAYFADLKIAPSAARGQVLLRLFAAAQHWAAARATSAYGVVMDGTASTPSAYTGRCGFPEFAPLAQIAVLRLSDPAQSAANDGDDIAGDLATPDMAQGHYRELIQGKIVPMGGDVAIRSESKAEWLSLADGSACGRLEDTRRAKRLFDSSGQEMASAHLACFACKNVEAGVKLLKIALARANDLGFPAMFVSVGRGDADKFVDRLRGIDVVVAPATIFGIGLPSRAEWNINTSEI